MTPCDYTVIEISGDAFAEFPAGCDPDFDTDFRDLERQFAELAAPSTTTHQERNPL